MLKKITALLFLSWITFGWIPMVVTGNMLYFTAWVLAPFIFFFILGVVAMWVSVLKDAFKKD